MKPGFLYIARLKPRFFYIAGLIVAAFAIISWRADLAIFGQDIDIPALAYESPVGQFTLPTVDGTAGTLGTDYELAQFAYGIKSYVPEVDGLAGDTGNGFSDSYDYQNLDAFPTLAQPANLIGDLDSLDDKNAVVVGGRKVNPGFRFVHIGRQAIVWRVGEDSDDIFTQEVTVFPTIDHLVDPDFMGYGPYELNPPPGGLGNVVLEATEFTVFGTNDPAEAKLASEVTDYFGYGGTGKLPNDKWFRATLTRIFTDGFRDYNGMSPLSENIDVTAPSPQEGDDFASQWQFRDDNGNPVPVKFVAVYANNTRDSKFYQPDPFGNVPGDLAPSHDAEIDGIGFKRFVLNRGALNDSEVATALSRTRTPGERLTAQTVAARLNAASYPFSIFIGIVCSMADP